MSSKRIDISLFDENLKALVETSTKIFPVEYALIASGLNPNNYDYVKVIDDTGHKNEIYTWDDVWYMIGADDANVVWSEIKNKPLTFPPSAHSHTAGDLPTIPTALSQLTDDPTHRTVTDTDKALWDTVSGKAAASHDHDGRYFTETEVTTALAGKSDTGHTHPYADVNHNHDSSYAAKAIEGNVAILEDQMYDVLNGYTSGHAHTNLATLETITPTKVSTWDTVTGKQDALGFTPVNTTDSRLSDSRKCNNTFDSAITARTNLGLDGISNATHYHDGRYTTTTDLNTALSAKADTSTLTGHTGNTTVHVLQADKDTWNAKQAALVSGTSIKTVNSTSLLGSGDVAVQATLVSGTNIKTVNSTSLLGSGNVAVQATLVSGTNIKTINGTSVLGSGDMVIEAGGGAVVVTGTTQPSDGEFWAKEVNTSSLALGGLISSSDDVPQGSTNLYTTSAEKAIWNGKQDDITSYNGKLSADVALTTSNTWYDGPSISLPAGTYMVSATVTAGRTSTGATTYYSRISDGTNHHVSVSNYMASVANSYVSAGMSAIITLASTTTIKIQTTTNSGASTAFMKAATAANGSGNNATQISAIKIA